MKRLRAGLLVCVCFPLLLAAADFKVPALTGRVVDQSGTLDGSGKIQIEAAIRNLEEASGGQMVVAFLNSIGDTPIEEVGIALGDAWKIGHKGKDNGAILIVVPADRQIRLEVGYGWEGAVNDARAGDVIRGLQEFFRRNDYAGGAVYAVNKVQEFVKGEAPTGSAPPRKTFSGGKLFFVVLFVVVFEMAVVGAAVATTIAAPALRSVALTGQPMSLGTPSMMAKRSLTLEMPPMRRISST